MGSTDIEQALQELVLQDADTEALEDRLRDVNLFEAIGAVRSELRHSDFLAFLLDPNGNHGLRDYFLRQLTQRAILDNVGAQHPPMTPLELGVWDLSDAVIEREMDDIDLLVVSERNKFAVVIENKVLSGEHSNQLARYHERISLRYPEYQKLFRYLTTDGSGPSHTAYLPISYTTIAGILERVIGGRIGALQQDIAGLLRHYVSMLRRHFMDDSELASLARRIYQNQ